MAGSFEISGAKEFGQKMAYAFFRAMHEEADILPDLFTELVQQNMHGAKRTSITNDSEKLYEGSGTLARATIPGQYGNITKVTVSEKGLDWQFGIDASKIVYALIHEYGGKIPADRPITVKMRKFFWFMYFSTKQQFWMNMALTKKTHITMKARAYWQPALDMLENVEMPSILDNIFQNARRYAEA